MFDLKGFRKDRKMSQKQISEILGIGTSFISQIETGKDPMPGYIPDKLADAYGKEEIEKYHRITSLAAIDAERGRNKFLFTKSGCFNAKFADNNSNDDPDTDDTINIKSSSDLMDRILFAIERRDELAFQQQREYERQGARIDELLSILRSR
jgi:transcriptional regulator with XRE-family HTH domain